MIYFWEEGFSTAGGLTSTVSYVSVKPLLMALPPSTMLVVKATPSKGKHSYTFLHENGIEGTMEGIYVSVGDLLGDRVEGNLDYAIRDAFNAKYETSFSRYDLVVVLPFGGLYPNHRLYFGTAYPGEGVTESHGPGAWTHD